MCAIWARFKYNTTLSSSYCLLTYPLVLKRTGDSRRRLHSLVVKKLAEKLQLIAYFIAMFWLALLYFTAHVGALHISGCATGCQLSDASRLTCINRWSQLSALLPLHVHQSTPVTNSVFTSDWQTDADRQQTKVISRCRNVCATQQIAFSCFFIVLEYFPFNYLVASAWICSVVVIRIH